MTYAGTWRTWHVKAQESGAEAASAAWLGTPESSAQHMTPYDPAEHGADTATGRLLLQAGHEWADAPPQTLSDHAEAPHPMSDGPTTSEGWSAGDHNVRWYDAPEEYHSSRGPAQPPVTDYNYPAANHGQDRGDIIGLQRRQIRRMQAADERDTSEQYQFAPYRLGGSAAQVEMSRVAGAVVSGQPGEIIAPKHEPGHDRGHASQPSVTWANAHGGPDGSPSMSTRNRRWVERRIPGKHVWAHDMRPLFWRLARTAATALPGTTHETSPFPSGPGLARTTVMMQPVIRRTPPAWDETATMDGSETGGLDLGGSQWGADGNFGGL